MLIGVIVFTLVPLLTTVFISFTSWDLMSDQRFIGLRNYIDIFSDQKVGREFLNTLYFAAGSVPVAIFLSLILASLLNSIICGLSIYGAIFFLHASKGHIKNGMANVRCINARYEPVIGAILYFYDDFYKGYIPDKVLDTLDEECIEHGLIRHGGESRKV